MARPFLIIAHRGAPNHAPENTLAAFDKALGLGFQHFELDAQLTADGAAVVFHDTALDRTSDGSGPLADRTLAELKRLDAGSWYSGAFAGERIPTLEEVLVRYHGRAYLHLELKSDEEALPGSVAELLTRTGWPTSEKVETGEGPSTLRHAQGIAGSGQGWPTFGVTISSFQKAQLDRIRPLLPEIPLAWLVQELSDDVLNEAKKAGLQMVSPRAATVTEEAVQQAMRCGFRVRAWGVRANEELAHLAACGVEGTTCDWPDEAREYLVQRGVATSP